MAEKILCGVLMAIYILLLGGAVWYFLFFFFSLLAEVSGWSALLVIGAGLYGLLAIFVNVSNTFSK